MSARAGTPTCRRIRLVAIPGGDLQPLDRVVKLRLSRRQLHGNRRPRDDFGITRSWFLREALALGIPRRRPPDPEAVADGYRPAGAALRGPNPGPGRGPQSDGKRPDRWVHAPRVRRRRRPRSDDPAYEQE